MPNCRAATIIQLLQLPIFILIVAQLSSRLSRHTVKDLGFAMKFGRDFGVPLDLAGHTMQTFIRAREAYGGDAWSSQVVKLLEDALGTDLRAPGFPAEL